MIRRDLLAAPTKPDPMSCGAVDMQHMPMPASGTTGSKPEWQIPGSGHTVSAAISGLKRLLLQGALYRYRGDVVRPIDNDRLIEVVEPAILITYIEKFVVPVVGDGGEENIKSLPFSMAKTMLKADDFRNGFPEIKAINHVRMPVKSDENQMSLLRPGFDEATGNLTSPRAIEYDTTLTLDDAKAYLDTLLEEFPFVDREADKARVVALLVTSYCLCLLSESCLIPAFLLNANDAGSGKGILSKLATMPVFPELATLPLTRNRIELEKQIFSVAKAGVPVIHYDNLSERLKSDALESFLTTGTYSGRILGKSEFRTFSKKVILILSGNNVVYSPDMRRRSIEIKLFMEELQAEHRKIKNPLDEATIAEMRPKLLACAHALVANWFELDCPEPDRILHGFEEWSNIVPGIVQAAGWPNPVPEPTPPEGDEDLVDMKVLMEEMVTSNEALKFQRVVAICQKNHLFAEIIPSSGGLSRASKTSFSRALKRFKSRRFSGVGHFLIDGQGHARRYRVRPETDTPSTT